MFSMRDGCYQRIPSRDWSRMMPNTLPVKIKISDLSQVKVRMRDFFTDYQMAVDSIGVIGEILGLNSSQYMTKSPQQVAEMVKTQAREAINRYELAERLVESVGFQSATDIRNLRTRVMELQQEKQFALMGFCDEILKVFAEFGYATPEKKYDTPTLILSDLREILKELKK